MMQIRQTWSEGTLPFLVRQPSSFGKSLESFLWNNLSEEMAFYGAQRVSTKECLGNTMGIKKCKLLSL